MTTDIPSSGGSDVIAAVDASAGRPQFVIADIARDDAWLSMEEGAAPALPEWR